MAKRRGKGSLNPEDRRKLTKANIKKLLGIFAYIKPYRWYFIFGMISLSFSSIILLAFPYLAGKLVDVADGKLWQLPVSLPFTKSEGNPYVVNDITIIAVLLFVILFVQSTFSFLRVYLFAQVNERAMADLRQDVYSKMVSLPMAFFDKRRVGELISRITSDVSILQDTFSVTLAELFRQIATLIIGTAIIFFMAPQLTVFMLLTFPILVIAALVFGNFIRKLSRTTQDKLAEANIIVEETLQSVSIVKAFTNELFERHRYKKALDELVAVALKAARYRGVFISFIIFVLFGGIVALLWYGASLVQNGTMESGELLSFVLYTVFIGGSIAGLGDIYGQIQRAIGASERVIEIIGEEGEPSHAPTDEKIPKGDIQFDNVSFSYPTRRELTVLKNLNFKIHASEKVALVGPSGAGKSTIIQLVMRFYPIDTGQITLDNRPLDSYDLTTYRENVGIVPQEVILFGGTIRENIAYGRPGASENDILEAANKANAMEFISRFPEGLETLVGERGVKLSGGQRQRIAIARAILKDPSLLILDEATSSLDAESEVLVQEALDELMKGRTSIIIAHRLSTIRKVDRIFVIKDGEIVESGNHETLSAREEGLYRNLLELQFQVN
jgi:ABC-type multidrug transport system fused ATPase/permease subunit